MKVKPKNTDDPRNHKFNELDQIIVLLNDPEAGNLFFRILTYSDGKFMEDCSSPVEFNFDDDYAELWRWEKIDVGN